MIFPSLHANHGLTVVNLDSLVPDYERNTVKIPDEIYATYNLGAGGWYRVRSCPSCRSTIKQEPLNKCRNRWHKKKPKGWARSGRK